MHNRALFVLLVAVSACTVGPDYARPDPTAPDAWHQELQGGVLQGETDLAQWWTVLEDTTLNRLIDRAKQGSLDLQVALARIKEARASLRITTGDRYPDIDANGSVTRFRNSERGAFAVPGTSDETSQFDLTADASWEIDAWGRISRSIEAAHGDYQAAVEDQRDVMVTLYSEVARNYIELRTLQERLAIARSNVASQRSSLAVTRSRLKVGLAPEVDVRQAEANLANTEATIPSLQQSIVASINRLAVLVGEKPHAMHGELAKPATIPTPPKKVVVGIPSNMLRQRPDIRAAERRLAAQTARIGVATADLYPRFTLFGSIGWSAENGGDMFDSPARTWNVGPSFSWNLLAFGRVRGNVQVQDALTEQLLKTYENTVLEGIEEVENALTGFIKEQQRRDTLVRSVAASRRAAQLQRDLYSKGLTDFQNVLDAERVVLNAEDSLASSRGQVVTNLVSLYKALGGGWQSP